MTKQKMMHRVLALTVVLCALLASAPCPIFADDNPKHNSQDNCKRLLRQADQELMPFFLWSVLAPPILPVEGSDGLIHLVYELTITSLVPAPARIETVEVIDPTRDNLVLDVTSGDKMTARLVPLPLQERAGLPPATLRPNETEVLLLDVTFETRKDVPEVLAHRVTVALDLAADPVEVTETGGCEEVSRRQALMLSPPLQGDGWFDVDGCCIDEEHRHTIFPSNGTLQISQRFATDFARIDAEGRTVVGDPTDVSHWVGYLAEVVAAAPGKVVTVVDGFPDEVPLQRPSDVTHANDAGNHVIIAMGGGRFALYAHLAPHSITVYEGERVRRGQRLGLLGNSGDTPIPHLHFHVTDGPSVFNSSGVPYVFDQWTFQGRGDLDLETGVVEVDPTGSGEKRRKELPLYYDVMSFRNPR
jgi:hypothetical protein